MKKLIVVLLFPLSAFAQDDVKVKICSNLNYFGRLGKVTYPLICSEDKKTGFAINVNVREIDGNLSYYGLCVQRHGIGGDMDSGMMVINFVDGTNYKIVSFAEKNYNDWSYFDRYGEHYDDFCKAKISSIQFINLTNNSSYSFKLKPEQVSFFYDAMKEIKRNKFYVGECN
jgi:hypothetical protein